MGERALELEHSSADLVLHCGLALLDMVVVMVVVNLTGRSSHGSVMGTSSRCSTGEETTTAGGSGVDGSASRCAARSEHFEGWFLFWNVLKYKVSCLGAESNDSWKDVL